MSKMTEQGSLLASSGARTGTLTGRHVLAITVSAFAVIIGVNLVMAWQAVSTFPGLEVKSSYVAGLGFDARRKAQERLGWEVVELYRDGALTVALQDGRGEAVEAGEFRVLLGRTTTAGEDIAPDFHFTKAGYRAEVALAEGLWMMKITARAADGTLFEKRVDFWVKG